MSDYDVVVIGAGSAGLVACKLANGLGKKTLLIEKNKIGGDCTWFGCIPSKTLIKSASTAHQLTRMKEFGLEPKGPIEVNAEKVMAHVREVVEADAAGHPADSYKAEGIDVIFGAPKFIDNQQIELNGQVISSKKFVICSGSQAFIPPYEGFDKIPYLTNETVFDLEVLPESMLVLGAGPIGIELSAALNRLGVKVTVLQRSAQILKKEDPELTERLVETLRDEGLTILTETKVKRFRQKTDKIITEIEDKQDSRQIEAESVLVAVGRVPNIDDLELEKAGIEYDSKGIKVDKHLRTTAKNIYAAGDVVPPYLFTHMAEYEAVIATTNACFGIPIKKTNYENVLWCTYTDPELAHAGLTEAQARERYGNSIRIYRWEHKDVDRAKTDLAQNGLTKVICTAKGKILGVHILGHGAAELMHETQLAKSLSLPFSRIASVIHAYPSYSDAIRQPAKRCYIDVLQNNFFVKTIRVLTNKKNRKTVITMIIILAILAVVLLSPLGSWLGTTAKNLLISGLDWAEGLGAFGPIFVAAFYIIACVLFLPGSILTLGAGFLFKLFLGTVTVSIGSTLGACAAFLVGRTVGRNWISRKVASNQKFAAIDSAVGREGFKIVLLTRLSPVFPFNLLNYAFGLTKVSFWNYALASWIGMLPGTVMFVYFGAGMRSLADVAVGKVETGSAGKIFFWLGMVATIIVAT
ncbi:MAG: FAD-dependent oxidoreductase, partial [Planctomycetota bacterium]